MTTTREAPVTGIERHYYVGRSSYERAKGMAMRSAELGYTAVLHLHSYAVPCPGLTAPVFGRPPEGCYRVAADTLFLTVIL